MKFRNKKPAVVEAMQFTYPPSADLLRWMGSAAGSYRKARHPDAKGELLVRDLEGDPKVCYVATEGDWLIKGVSGGIYPCRPDTFTATYEPVEGGEARLERDAYKRRLIEAEDLLAAQKRLADKAEVRVRELEAELEAARKHCALLIAELAPTVKDKRGFNSEDMRLIRKSWY